MTTRFGLPGELAELADEYEFVEELGRGGSAIVYRALDRALGRDVAIKVVHPRPTSPDDDPVARLAREARTVAQLHHPGIVSVYAVRRLRAGGLTLVMQFVPGATLKGSIQRGGPFGAARAEEILRDVALALAYAHARQVIHRDVKPENIFLDAESGRALLADFGIARSTEADSLTMTGTAIGTPFYMSPEQVDGMPVDGRSDLYSLGLVAWEMLTGLRPWDGESLYHVIYKQKHDHLPPIEALRPDVPRRLQYIVERMLQKQPAARWAGADGLLVQLDRRILPSDYAQWQAALPGRVARHQATASLRSAASQPARAGTAGAATVRFMPSLAPTPAPTPASTPALAHTQRVDLVDRTRDAAVAEASTPAVVNVVARAEEMAHAAQAAPEAPPADPLDTSRAEPVAPMLDDASVIALPAYETITPSWASPQVDAPSSPARRRRRALYSVAGAAALAVAGAVVLTSQGNARTAARRPTIAELPAARPAPTNAEPPRLPPAARHDPDTAASVRTTAVSGASPDLVTVGAHHACRISGAGVAQCWGRNDGAQLGDGSSVASSKAPVVVAGVMTYAALAAGASHTCGVTGAGDVYCWGANDHGQLGDGTMLSRSAPVRIGGAGTYRMVRGGNAHTCALDVEGVVRCWGDNTLGQLGNGTRASEPVPTLVHLASGTSAIAVATGARHSCALLNDHRVVCWGSNADGQLGVHGADAGADAGNEPREVPGVLASAIGAGDAHTCAVLLTGGVRCWGRDDAGQLGAGMPTDSAPGRVTVVPGYDEVRTAVGGGSQSCALTRTGRVWCWGRTSAGIRRVPVQLGRAQYVALASAANQSCAVADDHRAECWAVVSAGPVVARRARVVTRHHARGVTHRPTHRGVARR